MKVHTPDGERLVPTGASSEEESARRERVLKNVNVPLCGDLLGRERVTGAKKTEWGVTYTLSVSTISQRMPPCGMQSSHFLG